jgi:hypothetical protein
VYKRQALTANPGTLDDVAVRVGSTAARGTIALMVYVQYPTAATRSVQE